ncbi:MAG TPA: PilZ domain-containing protein [Gemmataceae bacterium]|nr:PilZ domain-containing protein [Gemmataceae bacterium]
MSPPDLQPVADIVVRRAQRQGYVIPREVRAELTEVGLPEAHWKDVLALARGALHYRQGRYYYLDTVSPRVQQEQSRQQAIAATVNQLIRAHKARAAEQERRQQGRVDFVQPVAVETEDGRCLNLLSRDLSPTGMRLLAAQGLLGQKLRLSLPVPGKNDPLVLVLRVLWTCAVGDGLFENGGTFLDVLPDGPPELQIVGAERST